jgi:hypothetical protein
VATLPCDLMIGAHPSVSDFDGKLKRRAERRTLAAAAMKGLDDRVAEETGKKKKE